MTPSDIDIDGLLRRLHLANARRIWRDLVARAEKEDWSHRDFLGILVAEEVAHRKQTRLQTFSRRAAFPFFKTIDDFDFTYQSSVRLSLLGSALSPDFVTEGQNLILMGKPGRGKTHLAVAIAYRAIQNGFDALFITAAELIDHLSSAFRQGAFAHALTKYTQPDILVVDEVGYLTYGTDAANMLFHVVNERHKHRRSMIFTTNKALGTWGRVLHDDDLAVAIIDRVLERGRLLQLDGPSMRTRHLGLDDPASPEAINLPARISGKTPAEFPEPTERTRRGRLYKLRAGVLIAPMVPYGYRWVPRQRAELGRVEIVPEHAELVRRIYHWVADEGLTVLGVSRRLMQHRIPPPKGGRRWAASTIQNMLRNRSYVGEWYLNRIMAVESKQPPKPGVYRRRRLSSARRRPPSEWIVVSGPALLDRDLFDAVEKRLADNKRFALRRAHNDNHLLLRCLLRCGACGYSIIGTWTQPRGQKGLVFRYYDCIKHTQPERYGDPQTKCAMAPMKAEVLDEVVWNDLRTVMSDPERIARYAGLDGDRTSQPLQREIDRLNREVEAHDRQLQRLVDAYQRGGLEMDDLLGRRQQIEGRKAVLVDALKQADAALHNAELRSAIRSQLPDLVRQVRAGLDSADFATRQRLVRLLIDRVVVQPNHDVEIHYVLPGPRRTAEPPKAPPGSGDPSGGTSRVSGDFRLHPERQLAVAARLLRDQHYLDYRCERRRVALDRSLDKVRWNRFSSRPVDRRVRDRVSSKTDSLGVTRRRSRWRRLVARRWRDQGYREATIAQYLLWEQLYWGYCLIHGLDYVRHLTQRDVERFAKVRARTRESKIKVTVANAKSALHTWSRSLASENEPVPAWIPARTPGPFHELLADYRDYCTRWRGVRASSIATEGYYVAQFLNALRQRRLSLSSLKPWMVDRYVMGLAGKWAPKTVSLACTAIRAFLRFLHVTDRSPVNLAPCVLAPLARRTARPPRAIPWQDVRRILAAIDRSSAIGKRDYAALLLMATYGMGAGEVLGLTLDDIDWSGGLLRVVRPKTGVEIMLPLIGPVGRAMVSYVRHGRPQAMDERLLFVRAAAPHPPLSTDALRLRFQLHARAAKVAGPVLGTHALRHSHASRQVEAAAPAKVVGDILGHRDPTSISAYARISTERLRAVSLPVPR